MIKPLVLLLTSLSALYAQAETAAEPQPKWQFGLGGQSNPGGLSRLFLLPNTISADSVRDV